ncbi:MAG: hypothetical protein ACRCSG_03150, partial [Cellulosilyticaceae bacterium]
QIQTRFEAVCKQSDIDPLFTLMVTHLNISIHQAFGFDIAPHQPYSSSVTSYLRDFLASLREQLECMPPVERKLRMQYFISVMPFTMQNATFYEYVLNGFTNVKSPIQNLYTAMFLSNILEQGGYFDNDSETDDDSSVPEYDDNDFSDMY